MCKWNTKFRSKRSNRENRPTFLEFPLFPGIFQWDETLIWVDLNKVKIVSWVRRWTYDASNQSTEWDQKAILAGQRVSVINFLPNEAKYLLSFKFLIY